MKRHSSDCFICYPLDDHDVALTYQNRLGRRFVRSWVCPKQVPRPEELPDDIRDRVEASSVVLLLVRDGKLGDYQKKELDVARTRRLPVVVVRLPGSDSGQGPSRIAEELEAQAGARYFEQLHIAPTGLLLWSVALCLLELRLPEVRRGVQRILGHSIRVGISVCVLLGSAWAAVTQGARVSRVGDRSEELTPVPRPSGPVIFESPRPTQQTPKGKKAGDSRRPGETPHDGGGHSTVTTAVDSLPPEMMQGRPPRAK